MSTYTTSPNMQLTIPVAGAEPGPQYASDVNASLTLIDQHDHTQGNGVQITPDGINLNKDLSFQTHSATFLLTSSYVSQSSTLDTSVYKNCVYVSGNELYYNDSASHPVKITNGGSVNATGTSLTGSGGSNATFVGSGPATLTVQGATSTAGDIDASTYILRYRGGYPSPSGNYIALQAPSSITPYAITFPVAKAANPFTFVAMDTSGSLYYTVADSTTVGVTGGSPNVLGIVNGGVNTLQLADSSVTTAKLNAQAVTNAKLTGKSLQVNSATTGNVLSSHSSGSAATSSGTFSNITNPGTGDILSGVITSTGRPIMITLVPDGTIGSGSTLNSTVELSAGGTGNLQLYRATGSHPPGTSGSPVVQWSFGAAGASSYPPGSFSFLDVTGGDTYTYTLQYAAAGGLLTVLNCKLYAWEI